MQCAICLGIPQEPVTMKCCRNKFCSECIRQWSQIRNRCPLCCAETEKQQSNRIQKKISVQSFDDGSLMIDTQITQLKSRVKFIEQRIKNKREHFKNFKSSISTALIHFLQKQLQRAKNLQGLIDEQNILMQRANVVQNMQLQVETILNIENALNNNFIPFEDNQEQFDYESSENDDSLSEYQQYQDFEFNEKKGGSSKSAKSRKSNNNAHEKKNNKSIKQQN